MTEAGGTKTYLHLTLLSKLGFTNKSSSKNEAPYSLLKGVAKGVGEGDPLPCPVFPKTYKDEIEPCFEDLLGTHLS